jgi:HD-GYP domain-containing protein (c-di-GMP phosphodiesterase class II)
MLKISDILKKAKKRKKQKQDKADSGQEPVSRKPASQPEVVPQKKEKEVSEEAVKQKTVKPQQKKQKPKQPETFADDNTGNNRKQVLDENQVLEVYKKAIGFVQDIMSPFDEGKKDAFADAKKIVRQFIDLLHSDEDALDKLFFADYFVEKGYLYQNSVNVCILCLRLAKELKYDHEHLTQLGLAALVHDIGQVDFDGIISRPARLSDDEIMEIRKHPIKGKDILKDLASDLNFEIFDVIHQEHERVDGSGYPYGLKGKEICEYAKLIGLVDVYEAMNHARPYRKKLNHTLIIKDLIANKNKFEHKFLKALIDIMGIYPVSTQVKLNTKEIAQVVRQNKKMPQRPVIKVTHDGQSQPLEQTKPIDLSKNFSVYIIDIVK